MSLVAERIGRISSPASWRRLSKSSMSKGLPTSTSSTGRAARSSERQHHVLAGERPRDQPRDQRHVELEGVDLPVAVAELLGDRLHDAVLVQLLAGAALGERQLERRHQLDGVQLAPVRLAGGDGLVEAGALQRLAGRGCPAAPPR